MSDDLDAAIAVVERRQRYVESRIEHAKKSNPYVGVPYRLAQQRIVEAILNDLRALKQKGG